MSARAILTGAVIGSALCLSNMYFGLTTGFVTMASIQAAVLGHAIYILEAPQWAPVCCRGRRTPLSVSETVILQTVSVAAATMPLAAGFVGILPALTLLTPDEARGRLTRFSAGQEVVWTLALVFFGVFLAVPLRHRFIVVEELKFPSGTATAVAIQALNSASAGLPTSSAPQEDSGADVAERPVPPRLQLGSGTAAAGTASLRIAGWALLGAITFTFVAFFVPVLAAMPVFGLAGGVAAGATAWGWTLSLSPSGMGQGAIMGLHTCVSMAAGAIVGWGVLGPLAQQQGWCKSIGDGKTYILWVSLAIMLADAFLGLAMTLASLAASSKTLRDALQPIVTACSVALGRGVVEAPLPAVEKSAASLELHPPLSGRRHGDLVDSGTAGELFAPPTAPHAAALSQSETVALLPRPPISAQIAAAPPEKEAAASDALPPPPARRCVPALVPDVQVPLWMWAAGLGASTAVAMAVLPLLMGLPWWEPLVAVAVSGPVAAIAVRALGQTDLNPVSGVGKLAQ